MGRSWAREMDWRGGGREKNIRGKGERSEEYEKREELAIENKKGRENIYIYIYVCVCVCVCVCVRARVRAPFALPM